ncbi:MAG: ABC transporter ATP-binding protein [Desulfobacterota bacterium]|nr:ABC transporter ATP-binding protein [Thermodesulfobacteriota bacterium]
MLELKGIWAQYDEKVIVLRNISMKVPDGSITCVLGPNGAGKTTLIKSIVNLVRPRKGEITFSGSRIERLRTHQIIKLGISVVPEGRQLFPKLTVAETLRMGAYFENDPRVIRQRMEELSDIFPIIKERRHQLAGTLSGGELGMLSIARALMAKPKMMILDEPSLGLSPIMTGRVFKTIHDISCTGITILIIEQNARKSLRISSYGYIMQKGEVMGEGDAAFLKECEIIKKAYLCGSRK